MMWIVLSAIVILFTGFRAAAAESLSSPNVASQIQRAYVANRDSNHISVIDTVTHAVIHTISLPFEQGGPTGVAVTLDGTRVYVSEENTGYGNFILVIDTATNQVIDTIPIEGQGLYEIAITPDGTKVYVVGTLSDNVSVMDTRSHRIIATIPIMHPFGMAITSDGKQVYVGGEESDEGLCGTVSVIDTVTNRVTESISIDGYGFYGIALTPDGTQAYVACGMNLSVIDTKTHEIIAIPIEATEVEITPDGTQVYVANIYGGTVSVIHVATNRVHTMQVGDHPFRMAITPDGTQVYVTNSGEGTTVSVIDTETNTIRATIPVGKGPLGIAIASME
jgi:YVTN family beta-propeller protein